MIHPARLVSVTIARPLAEVAAFLADPANFPRWASGLAGGLQPSPAGEGGEWAVATPEGRIRIRFSPPNSYGVADHWVTLPDGSVVYVPLRAVANGEGCEVTLTLFRLPGMDEARFAADLAWVERDLDRLRHVLEA